MLSLCSRECTGLHQRKTGSNHTVSIQQRDFEAHRPMGKLGQLHTTSVLYPSKHHCLVCENMFNWKSQYKLVNASNELYPHHNYYIYKFDASKLLRINVTLFRVYFSHSIQNCSFEQLMILNKGRTSENYCGIYSHLQIFSQSNSVYMAIKTKPFVVVNIQHMFYAIVEVDKIKTMKPAIHDGQLKWLIILGQNKELFNTYHIKVNPLYIICTKTNSVNQTQFQMFDGPGIYSPRIVPSQLHNNSTQYVSSSFQIVIYASGLFAMQYYKKQLQLNKKVKDNTDLHLPLKYNCTKTGICVVHIHAGEGFTVNASLHWLTQKGNYFTSNCGYSGIVFLTKSQNIITTECVRCEVEVLFEAKCLADKSGMYFVQALHLQEISFVHPKYHKFRKIYSGQEMYVVLFSSRGYSSMEADIHISKLECAVASIELCGSQINPIMQVLASKEPNLNCTIVQIEPWQGSDKGTCVRSFQLEYPSEWTPNNTREVAFIVEGFIAGTHSLSIWGFQQPINLLRVVFQSQK